MSKDLKNDVVDTYNKMDRYFQWVYNTYAKFVGKNVLDIGVGFGNMTKFYVHKTDLVIATDLNESVLEIVKKRFHNYNVITQTLNIESDDVSALKQHRLDTVICTNVIEHIEDDFKALLNMKAILANQGKIIILVPALPSLYNQFDRSAGHFRRYRRGELVALAHKAELKIVHRRYVNVLGIIPYYLKGKNSKKDVREQNQNDILCSSEIGEKASKLYNIASYIMEPVEKIIRFPWGLSELIVLQNA